MQIKEFDVALSTAIFEAKEIIKKDNNWYSDRLCIDHISIIPEVNDILVFTFKNWPMNDNTHYVVGLHRAINLYLVMKSIFKPHLEINKTISK